MTRKKNQSNQPVTISIHTLREEGDLDYYFPVFANLGISIHTLREEGDLLFLLFLLGITFISIHTLREEGDNRKV